MRIAQQAVEPMRLVGANVRAVIVFDLRAVEQVGAGSDADRIRREEPIVAEIANRERARRLNRVPVEERVAARHGEVALVGEVRALLELDVAHELGQQIVDVGVSLTVRVRAKVDRYAVDLSLEIGTVVELEAT